MFELHPRIDGRRLNRLAELIVRTGLNIQPGQQLFMSAPLEAHPLVSKVLEHAYKAGADYVYYLFTDEGALLTRFRHAREESFDVAPNWLYGALGAAFSSGKVARLAIAGENPLTLQGQDQQRVARYQHAQNVASAPMAIPIGGFATNWSIGAFPTRAWAQAVFPDMSGDEAVGRLWNCICAACLLDEADPVQAWFDHNARLHARCALLNAHRFDALHFVGPGTDLIVQLAFGHVWAGGSAIAQNGIEFNPNLPTFEVYTSPHNQGTNGTVSSSMPLFLNGVRVSNIRVRFENGRIVEMSADEGEEVFRALISTDEGAARLGEVALVPHSSPISLMAVLLMNTLFDENGADHIANGRSLRGRTFDASLAPAGCTDYGLNESNIHTDWMIGNGKMSVDGTYFDGRPGVALMRNGEWVS